MSTLAIDGSLYCSGYAVVEDGQLLKLGKHMTKISKATPTQQARLLSLYKELEAIVIDSKVHRIVVEDQYVGKNAETAMILGRVRGIIMLLAAMHKLEFIAYKPSIIKLAVCGVGNGNTDKITVYNTIRELYQTHPLVEMLLPIDGCVSTKRLSKNDDISDALAIAHTDILYQQVVS